MQIKVLKDGPATATTLELEKMEQKKEAEKMGRTLVKRQGTRMKGWEEFDELV